MRFTNKKIKSFIGLIACISIILTAFLSTFGVTYGYEAPGIDNVFGENRYGTSLAIADALKEELGVKQFDAVVVARGDAYPDALSGGFLAKQYSAPIILVPSKGNSTDSINYIRENLRSNGSIFILGGPASVSTDVENTLRRITPNVKRLYGPSRYDTNKAILDETMVGFNDLLICSGESFADALSASGAGRPIMLVGKNLTQDQETFIKEKSSTIRRIYIIGGTAAVSKNVEDQISKYRTPTRIFGANRFATSVAIANVFYPNATEVTYAYGRNYPDGLCGGVLSAKLKAPLLLTEQDAGFITAYGYVVRKPNIRHATIFGGSAVVSDDATGLVKNSGAKKTGLVDIGKKTFCTDPYGNLITRTFFTHDGSRYCASRTGELVKDTAFTVDGEYYGAMSDGRLAETGWAKTGKLYYYFKDYNITRESLQAKAILDEKGKNLTAAFNWAKDLTTYQFADSITYKWGAERFAYYGFTNKKGNAYVKSATLFYMAKMLGYNARLMYGTVDSDKKDHSWVEIVQDGTYYIYDPTLLPGWKISYSDQSSYSRYNYPKNVMQMEEID